MFVCKRETLWYFGWFQFTVREKKSKETTNDNSKDSKSPNKTEGNEGNEDNEIGSNSDLITSTIEETECDWEYAHVIT